MTKDPVKQGVSLGVYPSEPWSGVSCQLCKGDSSFPKSKTSEYRIKSPVLSQFEDAVLLPAVLTGDGVSWKYLLWKTP